MIAKEEIKDFELFSDLSERELEMVAAVTDREVCPTGTKLFLEGELNGTLYGVVKGALRIDKRVQADVNRLSVKSGAGTSSGRWGSSTGERIPPRPLR